MNRKKSRLVWFIFVLIIVFLYFGTPFFNGINLTPSGNVIQEGEKADSFAEINFIIEILSAEHLDENKEFISDFGDEAKSKDGVWTETISSEEYLRITFEENLDSRKDITVYPRIISGNPRIEIYEKDSDFVLAEFTNLKENEYNKIFLTKLIGEQDMFDLKILNGSLQFDHIIDPTELTFEDWESYQTDGTTSFTGNWTNAVGETPCGAIECNWQSDKGGTPSSGTGPGTSATNGVDHTLGTTSGIYIFTETSSPIASNNVFDLVSSNFSADDYILNISFWYHMQGTAMNNGANLTLNASQNGGPYDKLLFAQTGNLGNVWNNANLNLDDFGLNSGNISFKFRWKVSSSGSAFQNDAALDDINVSGVARATPAPQITIDSPQNITYTTGDIDYNITLDKDLDIAFASIDGGVNATMTNDSATHFYNLSGDHQTLSDGFYNITFWVNDTSGNANTSTQFFTIDTTSPSFSNHARNPTTPNEDQAIQLNVTITETNLETVIFEWNGTTNYTVNTNNGNEYFFTITSGNYTAHDAVTYHWYANDTAGNLNKSTQQAFTIANQIPSVSAPAINTTTPKTNDLISCNGGVFSDNDAEDSEQARFFRWFENDIEISGESSQTLSLTVSGLDKGDVIKCSIKVYDGFDNSSWTNSSNTATIQNSPPVITTLQTTVTRDANGTTYTFDYNETDADGDSITWSDNTTLFDINSGTGVISDTPTESDAGIHSILINASDGTDQDTDIFTYTINDVTNPSINVTFPQNISYVVDVSQLNYTFAETNPDRCWYSTDGGSTNSSTVSCGTNFTSVVSVEGSNTWTVYINDTGGNEASDLITFNKDTANPAVIINSPLNQNYNTTSILFNVTATDGGAISSCWYSLNSGITNISLTNTAGNEWAATNSSMTQGSHTTNFYCNDSNGNLNDTEQVTFFIDSINPLISFTTGTEANGTTVTRDWVFANVSVIETNEDTITFSLYNSTSLVNETSYTSGVRTINWTNLEDENYRYNVTINDTSGSSNETETRQITLDTEGPQVSTLTEFPSDPATYSENGVYRFNATITDPSLDAVWIQFDGTNYTATNVAGNIYNVTISGLSVGTYNYRWYANDSFGNLNDTENETYTINQANPGIGLTITPSTSETYLTETTATGSNCPSQIVCNLFREGVSVSNPDTQTLGAGTYNYTFNTTGNANYTSDSFSQNLIISKATGTVFTYVNNARANRTIEQFTSIYLNGTLENGTGTITLYNNGTLINQGSSPLSNFTNFTVIDLHNITTIYGGNENFTASSETWWVNVSEADVIPPQISLLQPENTSYNTIQTQLNYSASDNFALDTCWYSLNSGTTNTTIVCGTNVTGLDSGQGSSTWTIYANDTKGLENSSSITFFVDSINPTANYVSPTETDNSNLGRNYIQVNVTSSDTNPDTITIRLYNSTGNQIRTNTSSTSPFLINYTGLLEGTYFFNATSNDTLGNEISTATRNVSLVVPTLTINSPENKTYISSKDLDLEFTVSNEDAVWYNLDLGSNTTITGNTTFNASAGGNTLYLYANNTVGEIVKNVTFTVNSSRLKVIYGKFKGNKKGESTDFNKTSFTDLENISSVTLEQTDYGKIEFRVSLNLTDDENKGDKEVDIDSNINISENRIEINSTNLPNFNKSATLSLYNLTFSDPRILRDGEICSDSVCTKISYSGGILIFNVTHFTVYSSEETPVAASSSQSSSGSGSGGGGGYECVSNSECKEDEVCLDHQCAKLFDIKIIDFESPVKTGEFFDFTYFIKGVADINNDVEIEFWIEQNGKIATSGKDVIYIGSFEEKTETTKIFLPKSIESGVYEFRIRVTHPSYFAESHRTIEIEVDEKGLAEIKPISGEQKDNFLIIVIIIIILILLSQGKNLQRFRKRKTNREKIHLVNQNLFDPGKFISQATGIAEKNIASFYKKEVRKPTKPNMISTQTNELKKIIKHHGIKIPKTSKEEFPKMVGEISAKQKSNENFDIIQDMVQKEVKKKPTFREKYLAIKSKNMVPVKEKRFWKNQKALIVWLNNGIKKFR